MEARAWGRADEKGSVKAVAGRSLRAIRSLSVSLVLSAQVPQKKKNPPSCHPKEEHLCPMANVPPIPELGRDSLFLLPLKIP